MVDLQTHVFNVAPRATAFLRLKEFLYVAYGKAAAIGGFTCSSIVDSYSAEISSPFWVIALPPKSDFARSRFIFHVPAHCFCAMSGRVFGAALSSPSRFFTRSRGVKAIMATFAAFDAVATGNVAQSDMSVLTRFAGVEMTKPRLASNFLRRVQDAFRLKTHRLVDLAHRTASVVCIAFRDMSVSAWFAGKIESLAGGFGRSVLWDERATQVSLLCVNALHCYTDCMEGQAQ